MKKHIIYTIFLINACSLFAQKSVQDIYFDSNIPEVDIYIDGEKICKTPCIHYMNIHAYSKNIVAKKDGYITLNDIIGNQRYASSVVNQKDSGIIQYNQNGFYIEMKKKGSNPSYSEKTRHYILLTFSDLKLEAAKGETGEYISGLSALTGKNYDELIKEINLADSEVSLAHKLTGIE